MNSEHVVLGVDPGLQTTGYGLVRSQGGQVCLIEAGVIEGGSASLNLGSRLRNLYEGIESTLGEFSPDAMAMEQLYSHYAHPRTAILMGHARGVLALAAGRRGIPLFDYAATEVKSSLTGNGRASKVQVQKAVQATLSLSAIPEPADASDALAVAICHSLRQRSRLS